jgi:hypothetical protein
MDQLLKPGGGVRGRMVCVSLDLSRLQQLVSATGRVQIHPRAEARVADRGFRTLYIELEGRISGRMVPALAMAENICLARYGCQLPPIRLACGRGSRYTIQKSSQSIMASVAVANASGQKFWKSQKGLLAVQS